MRQSDNQEESRPGTYSPLSRRGFFKRAAPAGLPGSLFLDSCSLPATTSPVTLTILDQSQGLVPAAQDVIPGELRNFSQRTGIHVQMLAAPEIADDQLALWLRLLESHSKTPDVYSIDVIWPGLLAGHLIDLKPYLAPEIPSFLPRLIASIG